MKKLLQIPLLLVVLILSSIPISAHDFEVDDIYYEIESDSTVRVTYRGDSYSSYSKEYTGAVTVPTSVSYGGTTYSVTSIGASAFYDCTGLTSITIPNSVTSIGASAFCYTGLTSLTIPNSVIYIAGGTFHETPWYNNQPDGVVYINNVLYSYKGTMPIGTNIDIKDGTDLICDYAFYNRTGLTAITIPSSVTMIGLGAFGECTGLTTVNFNAVNCTKMGGPSSPDETFFSCSALTILNIGDNVINIPPMAFYNCTNLTTITIPSTSAMTTIGDHAFENCARVTSVSIPNSVTIIGKNAFRGCSGLTSIKVESDNTIYDSRENCNAIIETSTNALIRGCNNTVIPNSVTSIGDYAFNGCSGLTGDMIIPNSVTTIGTSAFNGCSGLTGDMIIPNSVTTIGTSAFGGCSGLTFVKIPNSVKEISAYVFYKCPNLSIDIEQGNDSIIITNSREQFTCKKVSIGRPLKYKNTDYSTNYNLFNSLSELAIDYQIEELTDYMFKGCKNLKVLSVGKGSSELKIGYLEEGRYYYDNSGKGLFYNLPLDSVYIGRPISYNELCGYSPFAHVFTLKHITLNCSNINKTLNPHLFKYCSGLESVKILNPHPQMSLSAEFFKDHTNLKSLTLPFPGTGTAQTTSNFGELFGTEANGNMRAVTQYFENGTNKTYYLPTGLEELVLTEGCEMIPYGGLYNCNMLKKLTLPTSLYMVGDKALYGCAQIADIYCNGADPAVAYDSSFDGMRLTSCKLHVPYNSSDRYKISDGWKRFYYVEEEAPLVVSIAKSIENAGVVYGINEYQPGQVAEVEAVAHSGYTFVGWYENGNLLTTDSKYTVMVTESHSLVAMFAPMLDENDVVVSPKAENVTLSWAQETGAAYYNIDIYSNAAMTMPVGSMVVDNSGQPVSRSATTVSATIDGLSELQNYYYSITAYGAEETILSKYTGSFSTIAGVEGVVGDTNAVEVARYDIHGRLLSAPIKGINIMKYSDGSTRKEFVK